MATNSTQLAKSGKFGDLRRRLVFLLLALKQAGLVGQIAKVVKVIKTGELTKAVKLTGVGATAGAKAAIEAAGGSIA